MKRLISILFAACICMIVHAQTPFDSFAPETSRPMLELESTPAVDTIMCVALVDVQQEKIVLVDVSTGEVTATAPITDDIRKWMSVDPLADKYPGISPYAYCGWNPVKYVDPDGGKPGTRGCIGLTGTASELSLFQKMVSPFTSGGNTSPLSVSIKGNPQCCRAVDKAKGWFVPLFSK